MNRLLLFALCSALIGPGALSAAAASERSTVSLDDLVLLAQSDISDQTIMTFLDYRVLKFALDVETVLMLRQAGVSEAVIRYLLEQAATANGARAAYTVVTDYSARAYPSYYYSSRRIGRSIYPFGWYDHGYLGYGYHTIHHYTPHDYHDYGAHRLGHGASVTLSHGTRGTLGHNGNASHTLNLGGGHRSRLHGTGHKSPITTHGIKHNSYSGGHSGSH